MTSVPARSRPPCRIVAKSLACGGCSGALFGILTLAVIFLVAGLAAGRPDVLGGIVLFGPFAAVVGSVIGAACGVPAAASLLMTRKADRRSAGRSSRARRDRAALAAGGGAALLPAAVGAWAAVRGAGAWAGIWWCVSAMAAFGGMAFGPGVLYGRRSRVRRARDRGQSARAGHDGQATAR